MNTLEISEKIDNKKSNVFSVLNTSKPIIIRKVVSIGHTQNRKYSLFLFNILNYFLAKITQYIILKNSQYCY